MRVIGRGREQPTQPEIRNQSRTNQARAMDRGGAPPESTAGIPNNRQETEGEQHDPSFDKAR
jgi:hypothetical protein